MGSWSNGAHLSRAALLNSRTLLTAAPRPTPSAALQERRQAPLHYFRHTFGTRMAAAGVPLSTLQEWMRHRDLTTTQIYSDYSPNEHEAEMVAAAFSIPQAAVLAPQTGRQQY